MDGPEKRRPAAGGGHGYLVLLVPLLGMIAVAVWLFNTDALDGTLAAADHQAREERVLLAVGATPPGDGTALLAALDGVPEEWPDDVRRAVAALLARTDWPPEAPAGSGRLLADRHPATWTDDEHETVRRLLELYRLQRHPDRVRQPAGGG